MKLMHANSGSHVRTAAKMDYANDDHITAQISTNVFCNILTYKKQLTAWLMVAVEAGRCGLDDG